MFELLSVVIHAARAAVRGRNELILENLLLRHQLQVALRPKRRLSLRRRDRFLWVWGDKSASDSKGLGEGRADVAKGDLGRHSA
jgi:hypothetical protein